MRSIRGGEASVGCTSLLRRKARRPRQHGACSLVGHQPRNPAARGNAGSSVIDRQDIVFLCLDGSGLVHEGKTVRLLPGKFEAQRARIDIQKGAHPFYRHEVPIEAMGSGRFVKAAVGDGRVHAQRGGMTIRAARPFQSAKARSGRLCSRSQSHALQQGLGAAPDCLLASRCDAASATASGSPWVTRKFTNWPSIAGLFICSRFSISRALGLTYQARRNRAVASSGAIWAALCAQYQKRAAFSLAKIKVCQRPAGKKGRIHARCLRQRLFGLGKIVRPPRTRAPAGSSSTRHRG